MNYGDIDFDELLKRSIYYSRLPVYEKKIDRIADEVARYAENNEEAYAMLTRLLSYDFTEKIQYIKKDNEIRRAYEIRKYEESQEEIGNSKQQCEVCGEWIVRKLLVGANNILGKRFLVCNKCLEKVSYHKTIKCEYCGEYDNKQFGGKLCWSCRQDDFLRKENTRVIGNNSRTLRLGLPSTLTLKEWIKILEDHENKCYLCGAGYEELDHVFPVSRGGGTTADNVKPICARCNMRKKDATNYVPPLEMF